MANNLEQYVSVNRQFLRSIRLDQDLGKSDALDGYILQPSAKSLLETIEKHLLNSQQRAFTWTGPYGGGKSSLALALASLVCGITSLRKIAQDVLGLKAGDGLSRYFAGKSPWLTLPIVGKRASVIDEIGAAIDANLQGNKGRKPIHNGKRDVIAELVRIAESRKDIGGVLLVIDELGKFLEFSAQNADDIGFYQDLAEAASRCKGKLVVIGILHQSFEQYASRLGQSVQQEWAKVQGRYVDIPLVAGTDEVVSLIGRALNVKMKHPESQKTATSVSRVIRKRRPGVISNIDKLLDACWPLHPVTAAMLGPASKKRFGQNERSVFSFLASAEPLGLAEALRGMDASQASYYWPSQFWDYLRANFEASIFASNDGHRWAACAEAVERTEARFSSLHVDLVKTVGLVDLLRNGSGLASESELLECSVSNATSKNVKSALSDLASASILIYRKHLDAWGIYAGSDFDIEQAVRNARAELGSIDISKISDYVDLGPVTARRHYWESGAMRWFARNIVLDINAISHLRGREQEGSQCGEFLLILPSKGSNEKARVQYVAKLSKSTGDIGTLIGSPSNADRIEELVSELAALKHVRDSSQKLHSDVVAMREINGRLQAVGLTLSDEIREAFNNAHWYSQGKQIKSNGLSKIASDIADKIYINSPSIRSELINRNTLSASASRAQKDLLHAMLSSSDQPNLGFTSHSAANGLYYTVIKALGLHDCIKNVWQFVIPTGVSSSNNQSLWVAANELIARPEKITSLDELYNLWTKPPYGIKKGLLPIFALAYFMARRNNLALYVEGIFTPDITEANVDEWLQDPRRIGWRFIKIEASEKKMLVALSTELGNRLGTSIAPDALDSARALVSLVFKLPQWVRRTERLSPQTKEVRSLLMHASDPHKVLFVDLPLVLDTRHPMELAKKIAVITNELSDAFEMRLRDVEKNLLKALDHYGTFKSLHHRGKTASGVGSNYKVEAFAIRISDYSGSIEDVESLLMLAIGKPSKDWTDNDIDTGEIQLLNWAMEFRRLESFASVRGRPSTRQAIGVVFGSKKTVTGTFDVSEDDAEQVLQLTNELMDKLKSTSIKNEVFLAAIAQVGANIFENLAYVDKRSRYE